MTLSSARWLLVVASILVSLTLTIAQTYSTCNPRISGGCPADPALGKSVSIDFTQGSSDSFTSNGIPTYDSNGAGFTVAKSGDSPQLNSKWYIMFGHVDFTIKAAPGTGVVSSAVLQSDDLDEIDWEWLGGDDTQVQSNYFGKGQTTTYNRGAFHPDPGNHDSFHKYSIDWTSEQIVWQIDGQTVRVLTPSSAEADQYPQTPMQIKVGAWSGGDPSNAPGTIAWAGGPTDYSAGPFTMYLKSIAVTDYSTGTSYTYSGSAGSWQSIESSGGTINGNSGGAVASVASSAAPAITSTSSGPMPFEGTHKDTTSVFTTPSVYPWIPMPTQTTLQTSTASVTTYPGLPSGWTVNSQGKAVPPSAAPQTPAPGPSSVSALSLDSPSTVGLEWTTGWNEQGFPTTYMVNPAAATAPKSYDVHGFLITPAPAAPSATAVAQADQQSTTATLFAEKQNAANRLKNPGNLAWGAVCGIVGGVMVL